MELSDKDREIIALKAKHGLLLGVPEGPLLPKFNPLELAQAIERLLTECAEKGHTKVTMHLDLIDAQAMATSLRKIALLP
jgi:hypothetical protein